MCEKSLFQHYKKDIMFNDPVTNFQFNFNENLPNPLKEIHNTLPDKIKRKFSVIYNHKYEGFEKIFIIKSSNEKWGALQFENDEYFVIVDSIYDSTGFYPHYNIIEAVLYSDGSYSGDKIISLFDTKGRIVKKLEDINHLNFDHFGNVIFSKNDLFGLLDQFFEEAISNKYKVISALQKNLFLVQEQNNSQQLLINEKDEIIFNFGFSNIVYQRLYNNKIIIKESETYYLLNINSGEKIKLKYDLIYPVSRLYDLSLWPTTKFITVTDYFDGDDDFYGSNGFFGDKFMTDEGKYGLINADGEICIPNIYDKMQQIHDDHFKVATGKFKFKIDHEKQEVISTGGKWGVINSKNEIIVPLKYTDIFYNKHKNSYIAYEGGEMIGFENPHDQNYWWSVKNGKEIKFKIL